MSVEYENRILPYLDAFTPKCSDCFEGMRPPSKRAHPTGDITSRLFFIADKPCATAQKAGTAFTEGADKYFQVIADYLGYEDYFATNICACNVPSGTAAVNTIHCVEKYLDPFLRRRAQYIDTIIICGSRAFKFASRTFMAPVTTEFNPGTRCGILLYNKYTDVFAMNSPSVSSNFVSTTDFTHQIASIKKIIERKHRLHPNVKN